MEGARGGFEGGKLKKKKAVTEHLIFISVVARYRYFLCIFVLLADRSGQLNQNVLEYNIVCGLCVNN